MTPTTPSRSALVSFQTIQTQVQTQEPILKHTLPEDICLTILEKYLPEDYGSLNKAFYKRQMAMWGDAIKLMKDEQSHPTMYQLIGDKRIKNLFQLKFRLLSEAVSGKHTNSEEYLKVMRNPNYDLEHLKELDVYIEQQTHKNSLDSFISSCKDCEVTVSISKDTDYVEYNRIIRALSQLDDRSVKKITRLHFLADGITRVPQYIKWFSALEHLEFERNKLTDLPKSMGQLTALKILRIDANCFTDFPEVICTLSDLTELDMANNQLTYIPASVGKLKNLKKVNFTNNKLKTLPFSIGNTGLKTIQLNNNPLESLPNVFNGFRDIIHDLGIAENPKFSLPATTKMPPLIEKEEEKQKPKENLEAPTLRRASKKFIK